jgi:replication factor C subunit 2/4
LREIDKRIIEPLASRCAKFRFKALDPVNTRERIEFIAEKEQVALKDGVLFFTM